MRERSWRREGSRMLSIKHKPVRRLAPPIIYHESDYVTMGTIVIPALRGRRKEKKMKNWKMSLIIAGTVLVVILMCIVSVQSAQNRAISLEEAVYTADSDIKVQEKRRVDLIYNLADCVKQYDRHESETLEGLANGMNNGNSINDVNTAIAAITYAYPELKSNENYKQLMNELSITENMIAQYRENYNKSVTAYNRYVKKFPARIFLNWTGYEAVQFERLDYQASVDAPQALFEE